jgi:hypothetical protein
MLLMAPDLFSMVAKPYIIGPGLKVVSSEEMMCSGVSID